jgi:hypothetical protein
MNLDEEFIIFLDSDGNILKEISFGIVPEGESKTLAVFVKNISDYILNDIDFVIESTKIIVIEKPTSLNPGEKRMLILKGITSKDDKEGLRIKILTVAYYVV